MKLGIVAPSPALGRCLTPSRPSLLISLLLLLALGITWALLHTPHEAPKPVAKHPSYAQALERAHNGRPGAARVLYQQLARTDLSEIRRSALYAELPNYPSPQALKLATADLKNP